MTSIEFESTSGGYIGRDFTERLEDKEGNFGIPSLGRRDSVAYPGLVDEEVRLAASRTRARLEAGESVGEIVRALRDDHRLAPIQVANSLMLVEPIGLGVARRIVEGHWGRPEQSLAHLRLGDLKLLAAVTQLPPGASKGWLTIHLQSALIENRPWLLVVSGEDPIKYASIKRRPVMPA